MTGPTLRIGVSGHQQIGDETTIRFVSQQLREILARFQQQAREQVQDIVGYSALALGADQLFVNIAFELGIPVEAVIPCAQYEELFDFAEARNEYYQMLGRSQQVYQLAFHDCTEDAYLAAGQWIVDHSDLLILVWDGYPTEGRGGTADVASYARLLRRPFIHINTRLHTTKQYGSLQADSGMTYGFPERELAVTKQIVYQGPELTVNQYIWQLPNRDEIVRDIVERPESVLVLPIGQKQNVLLSEKYDLGAGIWQLTLPGGKVDDPTLEGILQQAKKELRKEIGYRPGRLEKLLDFYSHPSYIAHKVHLLVAYDLEWDPLEMDDEEEVRVQTFTLDEALEATRIDFRFDPEAALALWLYARSRS
jgi:8-oxo-dGTP pyrophosphatase MutT (NUDIX family)